MSNQYEPMGLAARFIKRIQARGTRGDIIKCLAELIKNSDDAYDRLELQGKTTSGLIEIGCWRLKKEKRSSISGFYVRDYGSGMNIDKINKAFGKESYGEDTSDNTRNGAIGVGGKDAFYGMEDSNIVTVQNGNVATISIITTEKGILARKISTGEDAKALVSQINNMIKPHCNPIRLSENGTFAMFRIPESNTGKRTDTLQDNLTQYYTLRNIMEFPFRTVKVIDITTGQSFTLKHKPMDGETIFEKRLNIHHKGHPFTINVSIQKADHDLTHEKNLGYNIIIEDERGAVLDNTLFGFEDDPAAARIFGKIVIQNWKHLYRNVDQQVLTDNREGLDYNNPFNEQLRKQILQILKPILETEREKQGDNPKLVKNLDDNIQKAFSFINKIMQKDPNEGFEEAEEVDIPPDGIAFERGSLTIPPEKTRTVKLYLNPGKVPTNSIISVQILGEGISVTPTNSITTDSNYDQMTVPFVKFDVTGNKINTKSTLKAYFSDMEAELEIFVKPEETFYPAGGCAFVPKSLNLTKGKKKKIKLVLDTNLIKPGTPIEISSEDQRVKIYPEKLTVTYPPTLGKYLTEEKIEISSNVSEISSKVIATTKTIMNEDRQAFCKVRIYEKEPPKQFFKNYELDKKGDKRQRSRFKEGTVYVHVNAPILQNYFGTDLTRLNKNEPDAVAMLADTVVQCVTKEWARWRINTDKEDLLGDPETEIERVKNRLEYEHGAQLHQMIAHGYTSRTLS